MQIVVIGASGRMGNHVVRHAINMGHDVVAFVRQPSRLAMSHERLRVIIGNVQDPFRVERAMHYADVVINAIAPSPNDSEQEYSRGVQHAISAMHKRAVRRLVTVHQSHVLLPAQNTGFGAQLTRMLVRPYAPKLLKLDQVAVNHITQSALDWSMVLVHHLTDAPFTGQYQVDLQRHKLNTQASRANVADFALRIALNNNHIRQAPVIRDGASAQHRPTIPLRS